MVSKILSPSVPPPALRFKTAQPVPIGTFTGLLITSAFKRQPKIKKKKICRHTVKLQPMKRSCRRSLNAHPIKHIAFIISVCFF
jgi:hypothetical protein